MIDLIVNGSINPDALWILEKPCLITSLSGEQLADLQALDIHTLNEYDAYQVILRTMEWIPVDVIQFESPDGKKAILRKDDLNEGKANH